MNNRTQVVLTISLFAVLAWLFFMMFEYYEEEKDLGWDLEARRNPYLAAQIFHQQRGYTVTAVDSYLKLNELDNYETIFLASSGQIISQARLSQLIEWVNRGGHLVVAAQSATALENDRLFNYLELQIFETEYNYNLFDDAFSQSQGDAAENEEKEERKPSDELRKINNELEMQAATEADNKSMNPQEQVAAYEADIAPEELSRLEFKGVDGNLKAHFNPGLTLEHPAFGDEQWTGINYQVLYWAGSNYGTHFMQLEHGKGFISILSSPKIFQSDEIIYFDHSYLWQVLTDQDNLAILYGVNMPSLWYMLRKFMPEFLIAFGCLIFAWAWHKHQRFGPVFDNVVTVRRSSAEHIAASAAYTWRGNWQQNLLQPVREDIQQEAEKRVTGYEQAQADEKLKLLAEAANIDVAKVQDAMHNKQKLSEEHFYRSVRLLQRIRENI